MKISLISSKVTLSFLIFLITFLSPPPALSFIPLEKVAFKGGITKPYLYALTNCGKNSRPRFELDGKNSAVPLNQSLSAVTFVPIT